jgi:hypothetical protein
MPKGFKRGQILSPAWSVIAGLYIVVLLRLFASNEAIAIWAGAVSIVIIFIGLVRNKLRTGKWLRPLRERPSEGD